MAEGDSGISVQAIIDMAVAAAMDRVYSNIVNPLFRGVLYVGAMVAGTAAMVFLGSDMELGVSDGSWPGFVELPMFFSAILIDALTPVAQVPLTLFREVNGEILAAVSGFGILAPGIMLVVGAVEVLALGWLLMRLAELANLEGLVNLALGPIKRVWGAIR